MRLDELLDANRQCARGHPQAKNALLCVTERKGDHDQIGVETQPAFPKVCDFLHRVVPRDAQVEYFVPPRSTIVEKAFQSGGKRLAGGNPLTICERIAEHDDACNTIRFLQRRIRASEAESIHIADIGPEFIAAWGAVAIAAARLPEPEHAAGPLDHQQRDQHTACRSQTQTCKAQGS